MKQIYKFYPSLLLVTTLTIPLIAGAQAFSQVNIILANIYGTLNFLIALLFILATVIFLWGVIQYIAKGHDEAAQKKAKGLMLWGIIGLAVMASVWGIVNILIQYFLGGEIGRIPDKPGRL